MLISTKVAVNPKPFVARKKAMEKEMKLWVTAGKADRLLHSKVISRLLTDSPRVDEIISTYFDTPDLYFRRSGASLRVRMVGEKRLQTLKLNGSIKAGLFERDEFEGPVAGETPDLTSLRRLVDKKSASGASLLADANLEAQLKPLFATRISRSAAVIHLSDGTVFELALDDGTVDTRAGSSAPIHGIELELKRGAPDELYSLVLALLEDFPLRMDHYSKADRGYNLIVQEHATPVRAALLDLRKNDSVSEAFQKIVRNCLAQIHGNEQGVASGHDPASVHQMRVGLRRLRSALDLFAPVIDVPADFDRELRWIAGALGEARDWEVLVGNTLAQAFGPTADDADALTVSQAASHIAIENRKTAVIAVDSVRYTKLMIRFTRWIESIGHGDLGSPKERNKLDQPVVKFANATLMQRHDKLLKRGHRLADLSDKKRHRARIAAKKLRYATEFFSALFPKKEVKRYLGALSALQDDLGWRNDVVVADGLLRSLATSTPAAAAGAGFARGYFASRAAQDHGSLKSLWKKFSALTPPHS